MSELDPISSVPARSAGREGTIPFPNGSRGRDPQPTARFSRAELSQILDLYGRKVAQGEWRDYAIDMGRERAVFSVYRRASECALLRIEKTPKLARRQGAFCVVTASGMILKRGHDLGQVLKVIDKRVRLVKA